MQYFCNVPDCELADFVNPSLLCRFRQRLGAKGIAIIETAVFDLLRNSGAVKGDTLMMDSTVLSSNIIYPTDVILAKARHAVKLQRYPDRNWMPDQSLPST